VNKKGTIINNAAYIYDIYSTNEKSAFRKKQIDLLDLKVGQKVLDVGCGTGSLSVLAKKAVGEKGEVTGIDLSEKMISLAQKKSKHYGLECRYQIASIDEIPYSDNHFDTVICSKMFHHLPTNIKQAGMEEIYRVLKKNGKFLFFDYCMPKNLLGCWIIPFFIWSKIAREALFGDITSHFKAVNFINIKPVIRTMYGAGYLMNK